MSWGQRNQTATIKASTESHYQHPAPPIKELSEPSSTLPSSSETLNSKSVRKAIGDTLGPEFTARLDTFHIAEPLNLKESSPPVLMSAHPSCPSSPLSASSSTVHIWRPQQLASTSSRISKSSSNAPAPSATSSSGSGSSSGPSSRGSNKRTAYPSEGYGYEHDSVPREYTRTRQRTGSTSSVDTIRLKNDKHVHSASRSVSTTLTAAMPHRLTLDKDISTTDLKHKSSSGWTSFSTAEVHVKSKLRDALRPLAARHVHKVPLSTSTHLDKAPRTSFSSSTSSSTISKYPNNPFPPPYQLSSKPDSTSHNETTSSSLPSASSSSHHLDPPLDLPSVHSLTTYTIEKRRRYTLPPLNNGPHTSPGHESSPSIPILPISPDGKQRRYTLPPLDFSSYKPSDHKSSATFRSYSTPSSDEHGSTWSSLRTRTAEVEGASANKGRERVARDLDKVRREADDSGFGSSSSFSTHSSFTGTGSSSHSYRNVNSKATAHTSIDKDKDVRSGSHTSTGLTGIFSGVPKDKENFLKYLDTITYGTTSSTSSTSTTTTRCFEDGVLPSCLSPLHHSNPQVAPSEPLRTQNSNIAASPTLPTSQARIHNEQPDPALAQGQAQTQKAAVQASESEAETCTVPPTPHIPFHKVDFVSEPRNIDGAKARTGQALAPIVESGIKKDEFGCTQLSAEDLVLHVVFDEGPHFEFWDLDDDDFLVCPAKLFLLPKHAKKWAHKPLASPEGSITIIDIQCRTITCPSSPFLSAPDDCSDPMGAFTTKYMGTTTRDEKGNTIPFGPSLHAGGIVIDPKWHRTYAIPEMLKKLIALKNSPLPSAEIAGMATTPGTPSSLKEFPIHDVDTRGWYIDVWIPLPARLFFKKETRVFSVLANILMDQEDDTDGESDVGKRMGEMTDAELEELMDEDTLVSLGVMTVSHLRREREMIMMRGCSHKCC